MQLPLPLERPLSIPEGLTGDPSPASPGASGGVTFVRRRRARRYVLRVDAEGNVRVTIPRGGSRREADAFLARNRDWIEQQRASVRPPLVSAVVRQQLRQRAAVELPPRLEALAAVHGLQVARVSIRNQRTRWGSCGWNGHITLNWRLLLMPDWVSDYVIIHELMHLKRLDHSREYWQLVAAACPRYRDARRWLRAHADQLR